MYVHMSYSVPISTGPYAKTTGSVMLAQLEPPQENWILKDRANFNFPAGQWGVLRLVSASAVSSDQCSRSGDFSTVSVLAGWGCKCFKIHLWVNRIHRTS